MEETKQGFCVTLSPCVRTYVIILTNEIHLFKETLKIIDFYWLALLRKHYQLEGDTQHYWHIVTPNTLPKKLRWLVEEPNQVLWATLSVWPVLMCNTNQ